MILTALNVPSRFSLVLSESVLCPISLAQPITGDAPYSRLPLTEQRVKSCNIHCCLTINYVTFHVTPEFDLHSIEQPICAGQWEEMARLAAESPLAIALDEELIGCNTLERKQELLSTIRPQYIVIKPSLHGGICGGDEWITEAEKQQIGWWITSALESNIGLNAIAQWCATFSNPLPQGLGTGALFTDNVEVPLEIRKDCLWFCK